MSDIEHWPAGVPVLLSSTVKSFWVRIASVRSRLGLCAFFVMLPRALVMGFSLGLCRCRDFRAAALAGTGSWHVACARLSCTGVAGLPTARVARRLGKR